MAESGWVKSSWSGTQQQSDCVEVKAIESR